MHVAWVPAWYPSADAPLNGVFFEEQIQMLRAVGITTNVIAVDSASAWQIDKFTTTCDRDEGVIRTTVPLVPMGIVPGDRALIERQMRRIARLYEDTFGVPDVLHAQSVFPAVIAAAWLGRHWGIPWGLTEHRSTSVQRNPQSFRYRAIAPAVRNAAFRCAVSPRFAQKLSRYYDAPFSCYRLPVPDEYFAAPGTPDPDHFTFLHISTLERRKQVEETIAALAELYPDYPHARLVVVGGGEDRINELRALADEHGVGSAVEFLGPRSRDEIPALVRQADCFILVSTIESNGVVYAEALAAGVPIIGADSWGGSYATTPDVGILVPMRNHEALVGAMREMLDPAARTERFPAEQLQRVARARYSPQVFASVMTRLYSEAIANHR